jgi:uncharacterized protein (DUF1778 family)
MGKNISERIDMRITADQKKLIQIAASLDGCNTVSSFIIRTVINKSIKVIEKNYRVLKSFLLDSVKLHEYPAILDNGCMFSRKFLVPYKI